MKHSWFNKPHLEKMTWSHFWEYYKFHVIFGIFAVALVIFCVVSILSNKAPDLTVQIVGTPPVSQEKVSESFTAALSPIVIDANQDNTIKIDILTKNISNFRPAEEKAADGVQIIEWENVPSDSDRMILEKITLDLTVGEPALYIIDGSILKVYMSQGVFAPLEDLNLPPETPIISGISELEPDKTHTFAVSLAGNQMMERLGIPSDNKYIAVRIVNYEQKDDEALQKSYENAMNALKFILFNEK